MCTELIYLNLGYIKLNLVLSTTTVSHMQWDDEIKFHMLVSFSHVLVKLEINLSI